MRGNELLRRGAIRIANYESWLLWVFAAPLLFASNLPTWLFYASLLTIPFFWLARRMTRGAWSVTTPLDVPLALLICVGLVSVLISNAPQTSWKAYLELCGIIALYFGVVNGLRARTLENVNATHAIPNRIEISVWVLIGLAFAMGLVGVLGLRLSDKFLPVQIYPYLPKLDFAFLNPRGFTPNIVAGAIAPIVPLAFAFAFVRTRGWRIALFAAAFFMFAVVMATQSRGALIGLLLGFGVILLGRVQRLWWLVPIAAVCVGVLLLFIGPNVLLDAISVNDSTSTAIERFELWDRALRMLRDFPFTGIGVGTFEQTVLTLYPLFENKPGLPLPHAHNLYLQMGVDYGMGGLVAYVGLVFTALGIGWWNVRRAEKLRDESSSAHWLALGLLAGYVVFITHSLLDAVAVSAKVSVIVWMMLATLMALRTELARERETE